jgi:pyrroloquinoline-quinone synthase
VTGGEGVRLTEPEFRARLEQIGQERYHHRHPFHVRMHEGKLTRAQLQAWAFHRCYYQSRIPIKDSVILARSDDPEFRRAWRKRIVDHDGEVGGAPGGIEKWLKLVEVTGGDRERATRGDGVLPAVRYAVDAYVHYVSTHSLLEAVASSFTELFSHKLIALRMDALRTHYPWMEPGFAYFQGRLTQAPEDAEFAVGWVYRHAETRADQDRACAALEAKCDILWAVLDALYFSYVEPGWPPPGTPSLEG